MKGGKTELIFHPLSFIPHSSSFHHASFDGKDKRHIEAVIHGDS